MFNPHGELDDWFYAPMFTGMLEDSYTVMEHEMVGIQLNVPGQWLFVISFLIAHSQRRIKRATLSNGSMVQ